MQTHLACRFDVPSMSPAHAGVGLGRRSSISRRFFCRQVTGHCHLGQLKGDAAPVSDDLGTDLHQLLPQCGQWPVFDLLGQRQRPPLAILGPGGHVRFTSGILSASDILTLISALPLIAEDRAPMSAFAPISSASHPGADLPGGFTEGPFLTHFGQLNSGTGMAEMLLCRCES